MACYVRTLDGKLAATLNPLTVKVVVEGWITAISALLTFHKQCDGSSFSERQRGKRNGLVNDGTELWQGNWKESAASGRATEDSLSLKKCLRKKQNRQEGCVHCQTGIKVETR